MPLSTFYELSAKDTGEGVRHASLLDAVVDELNNQKWQPITACWAMKESLTTCAVSIMLETTGVRLPQTLTPCFGFVSSSDHGMQNRFYGGAWEESTNSAAVFHEDKLPSRRAYRLTTNLKEEAKSAVDVLSVKARLWYGEIDWLVSVPVTHGEAGWLVLEAQRLRLMHPRRLLEVGVEMSRINRYDGKMEGWNCWNLLRAFGSANRKASPFTSMKNLYGVHQMIREFANRRKQRWD